MALTKEQELAQLVEKLNHLFEGDDSFAKVKDRVKVVTEWFDGVKDLDLNQVVTEVEKLRATQDKLTSQIRNSKNGFYVPGIEDETFSLVKALVGVVTNDWKGREKEQEIMDQARRKASQNIGDDSLGGYFVPDQVIPEVISAIYTRSVLINLAGDGQTRVSLLEGLTGGNVKIPKFDGGLIAYWIGEEDEYAESTTNVGDITLNPKKLGVLVKLTDSMRRLGAFGFESLLRNDMIRATAKKLDWTLMFGTGGDNMPRGIFNHPEIKVYAAENSTVYANRAAAVAGLTDWQGGELDFDGLDNMQLGLEEDDIVIDSTHAWISSPRYFKRVKQLKVDNYTGQTANRPYLIGVPMLPNSRLADIIGPFDSSNQISSAGLPGASMGLPTTDTSPTDDLYTTLLGGNLGEVVLGRWAGIEIEDDAGRGKGFTSDHTYVKLRMYADLNIRQPRSIIVCPDAKARG